MKSSSQTLPNVGLVTVMKVEYWPTGCFCIYQAYTYSVFCSVLSKFFCLSAEIVEYLVRLTGYNNICTFVKERKSFGCYFKVWQQTRTTPDNVSCFLNNYLGMTRNFVVIFTEPSSTAVNFTPE